jgi:hypothetical protein
MDRKSPIVIKARLTSALYTFVVMETVAAVLRATVGTSAAEPGHVVGRSTDTPNERSKLLAQASGTGAISIQCIGDLDEQSTSLSSAEAEGPARLDEILAPLEWTNLRLSHEVAVGFAPEVGFGGGFQGGELHLNPIDGRVQVESAVGADNWPCAGYPLLRCSIVVFALRLNHAAREFRLLERENSPSSDSLLIVETLLFCHLIVRNGFLCIRKVLQRLPCACPSDFALLKNVPDPRLQFFAD